MKEIVHDKFGNTIYLTDERWNHIIKRHALLKDRKNDILKTLRSGKRRRDDSHLDTFSYVKAFANLPFGFTHIKVIVLFRVKSGKPNNFVLTAYPTTKR